MTRRMVNCIARGCGMGREKSMRVILRKVIVSAKDVEEVMEQEPELVAEDSEDEEETVRPKYDKYDKEDGELHSQGLWYGEGEENESNPEESDSDVEELGLQEEETEEVVEGDFEQQDSVSE